MVKSSDYVNGERRLPWPNEILRYHITIDIMPKELLFAFARWIEVRETEVIMVVEAMYKETTEVVKVEGDTSEQFAMEA